MVDPIDDGFAFGGKRRDHQRHRSAQVRCHDRRALELRDAFDGCAFAVEVDARAKPRQLADMHETVFKNRLGDVRGAVRPRHQRHELRLQIGRKFGKRRSRHIDRRQAVAHTVAGDANALIGRRDRHASANQHVERRLQEFRPRIQ